MCFRKEKLQIAEQKKIETYIFWNLMRILFDFIKCFVCTEYGSRLTEIVRIFCVIHTNLHIRSVLFMLEGVLYSLPADATQIRHSSQMEKTPICMKYYGKPAHA